MPLIIVPSSLWEGPEHNNQLSGGILTLISRLLTAGEAIPLGGLVDPSGHLMLLGDYFTEPLSGKTARVHGAHLLRGKVLPHGGSYQAVLEAGCLQTQTHVVNALKQFRASVLEDTCLAADRLAALKASAEDMKKSFTARFYHAMYCLQNLKKKQEIASNLKSNGGNLGRFKTVHFKSKGVSLYSWWHQ